MAFPLAGIVLRPRHTAYFRRVRVTKYVESISSYGNGSLKPICKFGLSHLEQVVRHKLYYPEDQD